MGKIFVVRPPTTKTTNILPHENYQLYGMLLEHKNMLYNIIYNIIFLSFNNHFNNESTTGADASVEMPKLHNIKLLYT